MAVGRPPPRTPIAPVPPRRSLEGELPLDLREARLPWLEAEESDELRRGGSGRLLALAFALVVLVGVGVAVVWYGYHQREAAKMVATGEIIHAPAGPYKVRPANPGGAVADGTGDTSFLVAQGRTRSVHVSGDARDNPVGAPGDPSGAVGGGVGVQLGAYASGAEAEAAWPPLAARFPLLSGLRHRVVEQQAEVGSVFALQAVTENARAGQALCHDLRAGSLNCMVRD